MQKLPLKYLNMNLHAANKETSMHLIELSPFVPYETIILPYGT